MSRDLEVLQMLCPTSKWYRKCGHEMTPIGITIHNTANDASAKNEISYMLSNNNYCSFHYAVDDKRAVQGILTDRNGWHAGDGAKGTGNRKTIAIEICYSKSGGGRYLSAEDNTAYLVSELMKYNNFTINQVYKHQKWSGKYCPHRILDNNGWDKFLARVMYYYNYIDEVVPIQNEFEELYNKEVKKNIALTLTNDNLVSVNEDIIEDMIAIQEIVKKY